MNRADRQCEKLDFRVVDQADIDNALDHAIRTLLAGCFPRDRDHFSHCSWWHSIPQWRVLVSDDRGQIVGHVAVVERGVKVDSARQPVHVAGIQSVAVHPVWRGKDISERMLELVIDEAEHRHLQAGLLFCREPLLKVYGRMGWQHTGAKTCARDDDQRAVPLADYNHVMVYPLAWNRFPDGAIDLAGPDW